jgi:hypothetical protein
VILGNADAFLLEVPADSPEPITEAQLERREWSVARLTHGISSRSSFPPSTSARRRAFRAFHGSPAFL